ncbi:hypothetical protein BKA65DRAFT_483571 [Rhexocercosporidium sp. MPI-PUGE-AT-0058]|nr:hypothetical protein BKA65DRAFT_483571 [Rhexocercosporidium sp. MPI-PUGE-AT-0058]
MPPSQQPLFADEDCNLPSQERVSLLERLQISLGDVPPRFWAACHLCDVRKLELLVQTAELNPNIVHIAAGQTYTMVSNWNQAIPGSASTATTPRSSPILHRPQASLSGPSSSPQDADTPPAKRQKTSFARSRSARDSAEKRDNSRCVLTGTTATDVAHIYPFCLLKKEEDTFGIRHFFWRILRNFWPEEKITTWEAAIFPDGTEERGLETCRNMITISADAHKLWNKGAFALKPISVSEDNTTLTIQFFWQAKHALVMPIVNLTTIPMSTRNLDSNDGAYLYHQSDDRRIKSGDLFELITDDPEARPLPSMALLEMQWFLQRVIGIAGAADELEDNDYHFSDGGFHNWRLYNDGDDVSNLGEFDEDDGDVSNLGLDEGGDESFLSNITSLPDPIVPDNTGVLPSTEAPKHHTEEMEKVEERFRDGAVM